MNVLGRRDVELGSLQLARQLVAERKATPNVTDLGADLKKWGAYLHDPWVRQVEGALAVITGRDRIVGAMAIGRKALPCVVIECTDAEAEELELVENLHRRCDPDEQAAQRRAHLDFLERRQADEPEDEDPKPGRKKSPRAKAREELAAKEGVTPEALRRQEQRHEPEQTWGGEEEAAPSIKDFGLAVPPTVDARARRVQAVVDEADTHLRALARLVNGLQESGLVESEAQKAQAEYNRFAHFMRGLRPQALCPSCKGVASDKCLGCLGAGFASAERMKHDLPPALLLEGEKAMVVDGKGGFRSLSGKAGPPPRVQNGKRLTTVVVDADGNETIVDPETGKALLF